MTVTSMILDSVPIEVTQSTTLLVVAVIGFLGTILAAVAGVILTTRYATRSAKAAVVAAEGIEAAKEAAAAAQAAAANAARELVIAAQRSDQHLDAIQQETAETRTVVAGIHLVVNNQRTILKRRLMYAAQDLAKAYPDDPIKQERARQAERDVADALAAANDPNADLVTSRSDIANMPPAGPFPPPAG